MKIEEEINQSKFNSAQEKAIVNIIFTANAIEDAFKNAFSAFIITYSPSTCLAALIIAKIFILTSYCPVEPNPPSPLEEEEISCDGTQLNRVTG